MEEPINYGELGKFYIPQKTMEKEFNREAAKEEKARIDYILHNKKDYCHKHMCHFPISEGCPLCNKLDADNINFTSQPVQEANSSQNLNKPKETI